MPTSSVTTSRILEQVRQICVEKNLRFTAIRREVLALLLQEKEPCKAYALLERLPGHKHQPTAVYRALDFLLQHGFAHKIHTQNGYTACRHPEHAHDCYFLICRHCNIAQECCNSTAERAIRKTVRDNAFEESNAIIEIVGACKKCAHK